MNISYNIDLIYNVLDTNTKTINEINTVLASYGYYDDIRKMVGELDILYTKRVSITKANIFKSFISEWLPRISLGRQSGHTTAIAKFIMMNPELNIGIVTDNQNIYDELFRTCRDILGKRPKNMFRVKNGGDNNHLRGISIDYAIIECYNSTKLNQKTFEDLLVQSRKGMLIMGVGN